MNHFEDAFKISQGKDWFYLNKSKDFSKSQIDKLHKIRFQNVEDNLKNMDTLTIFVDVCIHLQRIYRIIADRYTTNTQEKIDILTKAYEVSKKSWFFLILLFIKISKTSLSLRI